MLNHGHRLSFIGSCFGEHISRSLAALKCDVHMNPLGACYHPQQIVNILNHLFGITPLNPHAIFSHDGLFKHPMLHSAMNHVSAQGLVDQLSQSFGMWEHIDAPHQLFITLGTSVGYRSIDRQEFVGNCHGMNKELFTRHLTTSDEIFMLLSDAIKVWTRKANTLQVHITISPVRYIKYGYVLNNTSKSHLLIAADTINKEGIASYIPVYEWVIDELRDYRYFDEKGSHPNQSAREYVQKKLIKEYFNTKDQALFQEIESVLTAVDYVPEHPEAHSYQKYLPQIIQKTQDLARDHKLDFNKEIKTLQSRLIS